jgi:hypothetical protein
VSGTTYRLTIPAHGYNSGQFLMICCADPAWTNGWASMEKTGPLGSGYSILAATADTVDVAFPNSPTGTYPACCTLSDDYTLHAQNLTQATNDGPYYATAAEYAAAVHPFVRYAKGGKPLDQYWPATYYGTSGAYHKSSMLQLSTLLDLGLETFTGVDVRQLHNWAKSNMLGYSLELGSFPSCGYTHRRDLQMSECSNPMMAYRERPKLRNLAVSPGQTQVHFRFTAPNGAGAKVAVMPAPNGNEIFADSRDAGDMAAACMGRDCVYVAAGLTAGTRYRYRISGGAIGGTARTEGYVTTAAGGGTTDSALGFTPPEGRGIVDMVVEHGATESLGSVEPPVSCVPGCTVTLTAMPANAVRFVRYSYRNAAGVTVASGNMSFLVR